MVQKFHMKYNFMASDKTIKLKSINQMEILYVTTLKMKLGFHKINPINILSKLIRDNRKIFVPFRFSWKSRFLYALEYNSMMYSLF